MKKRQINAAVIGLMLGATLATPTQAEDAAKTGLLAGLGVAAATGKTSLEGSAGAIEAGLLSAEAFRKSAELIAGVTEKVATGRNVVLVGEKDNLDLISPKIILDQIKAARKFLDDDRNRKCPAVPTPAIADPTGSVSNYYLNDSGAFKSLLKFTPGDAAGIMITDTSIAALELPKSDNRMINALMMTRRTPLLSDVLDGNWETPNLSKGRIPVTMKMTIAGETVGWATTSLVRSEYEDLVHDLAKPSRSCPDDKKRAVQDERTLTVLKSAKALADSLVDAKEGPSVLARSIQAEAFVGANPIIVRTVVEQIGGTSIARSGVLYTFGWPDAATVSSGLIVSFRVIDPLAAKLVALGEVRCLTAQTNVKKVRQHLIHLSKVDDEKTTAQTVCDYRATKVA